MRVSWFTWSGRALQNAVLLSGAAMFGFGACSIATLLLLMNTLGEPRGENFGGAIAFLLATATAGFLGTAAGLVTGVRWIRRHGRRDHTLPDWIGMTGGAVIGLRISQMIAAAMSRRPAEWVQWCMFGIAMPLVAVAGYWIVFAFRNSRNSENSA